MNAQTLTWGIAGLATAGVIVRPFNWPEAIWAVTGALLLVLSGLLPMQMAWTGVAKGYDVYFFLTGMMLLSELARREGLFDWIAALATRMAKGSPTRLFLLIYAVGTVVTIFLSNDATAVVLTPAVYAATKAAKIDDPLPHLFICAFIANAASFVLPISNPANLVVFGGGHMPPLFGWLRTFALPSLISIVATYLVLRLTQHRTLTQQTLARDVKQMALPAYGKVTAGGILLTGGVLIAASAFGIDLGLPTFVAGAATACLILIRKRETPIAIGKNISWGVLPLVAGLFVLVEALDKTGVIRTLADLLKQSSAAQPRYAAAGAGVLVAVVSNLVNNLPAGLVAGSAVAAAEVPKTVAGAILIGVDLGPNLSVTGSLATILWLTALHREGQKVSAWHFLKFGLLVMPAALIPAIAALLLAG
jgi:arsenical pump membrane protein